MMNGKLCLAEVGVGPMGMAYGALLWDRPDIELLMFEPHPVYYQQVREAANGRPNVHLFNVAIGDEPGQLKLYDEGTSSSLAGVSSPMAQHRAEDPNAKPYHLVDVKRISDYDTGQIDILRVDTEGAEWACIKHLVSRPKQIVVEIYNDLATYINPHLAEIAAWAKLNGYTRTAVQDADFVYTRS